jgi:NADH:ubiquinone oxidoreductase subunit 3 (subunit A)
VVVFVLVAVLVLVLVLVLVDALLKRALECPGLSVYEHGLEHEHGQRTRS